MLRTVLTQNVPPVFDQTVPQPAFAAHRMTARMRLFDRMTAPPSNGVRGTRAGASDAKVAPTVLVRPSSYDDFNGRAVCPAGPSDWE